VNFPTGRRAQIVAQIQARRAMRITRPRRRPPRTPPYTRIAEDFTRAIWRFVERIRPAFADLEAELPRLLESARRERGDAADRAMRDDTPTAFLRVGGAERRIDAGEGKRARELVDAAKAKVASVIDTHAIDRLAEEFAVRTATHQRKAMQRQVRNALGADVFVADRKVEPFLEAWTQQSVALIRNIGPEVAAKVERVVLDAVAAGRLPKDLAKDLDAAFGFGKERAAFIASDQIGKAYAGVTKARHEDLGVTHFFWRTVHDRRVRGTPGGKYPKAKPSHYDRDGKRYAYADPPRGRNGEPELPGTPPRCRCTAEPDFSSLLGDLGHDVPPPAPVATDAAPIPAAKREAFVDRLQVKPLGAADRQAVYDYQGGGYVKLQAFAREADWQGGYHTKKEALADQKRFDAAIAKGALPDAAVLYRGIEGRIVDGLTVGGTFEDLGYSSTSMSREIAEDFASRRAAGVILEIVAPAGTPAAFVPAAGGLDEAELVLGRGSRFRVVGENSRNGRRILRVALI
jgi:SPP1 gp7 family putative phage head morphogenesis protein